jgi:Icc-related predicted phosphoesterase
VIEHFKPRYLVHGHVHVYHPGQPSETRYRETTVVNAYGYRILDMDDATLK